MKLIRNLFRYVTWKLPTVEKVLYLTFDDGPIPEVTPWVLEELKKYNASATFFCIGENVKKHPAVYQSIDTEIHSIGNHTMHHLNGWMVRNSTYYTDISSASKVISSKLFRPPYGKIRLTQMNHLRKQFTIIMWDVLSKDYDADYTGHQCFERILKSTKPGSIVVFHDSLKAEKRLREALPKTLEYFSKQGYEFLKIPNR